MVGLWFSGCFRFGWIIWFFILWRIDGSLRPGLFNRFFGFRKFDRRFGLRIRYFDRSFRFRWEHWTLGTWWSYGVLWPRRSSAIILLCIVVVISVLTISVLLFFLFFIFVIPVIIVALVLEFVPIVIPRVFFSRILVTQKVILLVERNVGDPLVLCQCISKERRNVHGDSLKLSERKLLLDSGIEYLL